VLLLRPNLAVVDRSMNDFLRRKSLPGKVIHRLKPRGHHPARRGQYVTVTQWCARQSHPTKATNRTFGGYLRAGYGTGRRVVDCQLHSWPSRHRPTRRGRHREQVAARRRENHFGAELVRKVVGRRRKSEKGEEDTSRRDNMPIVKGCVRFHLMQLAELVTVRAR
jgi:hypothetical protein